MSAKRVLTIVLVASAVLLAVGIGPQFTGTARALPPALAGAPGQPAHSASGLTQTTVTLTAVADATLKRTEPDANFGGDALLGTYFSEGEVIAEEISLVRFDHSAVPAEATIESAVLGLWLEETTGLSPVTVGVYYVTSAWNEYDVTWSQLLSWETLGLSWALDNVIGRYDERDITGYAQAWHSGSNNGLALRGPHGAGQPIWGRWFQSRHPSANPPRLVVTYHMPPVETLAVGDVTLNSDAPGVNTGDEPALGVGWDGEGGEHIQRALLRFPALELPAGAWVEEAWLELAPMGGEEGVVARVTEDWSEYSATWQSQPGYGRPLAGLQPDEAGRWNVTELVNGWQLGLYPNYGLALLETAGTPGMASYSSRQGSQAPRLVINYALGASSSEELEPLSPPGSGPPSFTVDPSLEPFQDTLAPMLVAGESVTRPLVVLQAELDTPFTFIADEVIYTPASPGALEAFLGTYGGRVLREPGLPEPPPGFDGETRDIEPDPGYLIQVDPMRMNLDSMEADASALGLRGEMRLSSDVALHLLALVLYEQNGGVDVSLDGAGQFIAYPSFPSLGFEEEPITGGFEDPIGESTRYPEMSDMTTQQTGVNRAWQYVAFANRASAGVEVAIIDGGFCLDGSGGRCTESGRMMSCINRSNGRVCRRAHAS